MNEFVLFFVLVFVLVHENNTAVHSLHYFQVHKIMYVQIIGNCVGKITRLIFLIDNTSYSVRLW